MKHTTNSRLSKLDRMSLGKALHGELLGVLAGSDVVPAPELLENQMDKRPLDLDEPSLGSRKRFGFDYGQWRKARLRYNRQEHGYREYLKFHHMPFDLLPNCAGIVRSKRKQDGLSRLFGVEVKEKCPYSLSFRWLNGGSNTKLMILYNQLLRAVQGNPTKKSVLYWSTARRLMYMKEFQLAALCVVCPSWPLGGDSGNLTLARVHKLLAEVDRIVSLRGQENIEFRRVYIPKDERLGLVEGNVRPLGVPSLAWRVYLRMLNNLLVFYYSGDVEYQHAYQSGKSVVTAWLDILDQLDKWPSIYEFDLSGFFDNVTHSSIESVLEELEVPDEQVSEFMGLCRSIPVLRDVDLKEEPDRGYRFLSDGRPNPGYRPELYTSDYKAVGVPQGAAISCGLSILVNMYQARRRKVGGSNIDEKLCVYYADDGIAFMSRDGLETHVDSPERGLTRSLKKCKPVKENGKYVSDHLKFLGLELDLNTWEFRSQTRGGNSVPLTLSKRKWLLLKTELRNLSEAFAEAWYEECQVWSELERDSAPYPYTPHSPADAVRRVLTWLPSKGVLLDEPLQSSSWVLSVNSEEAKAIKLEGDLQSLSRVLRTRDMGYALSCMYRGSWSIEQIKTKAPKPGRDSWWDLIGLPYMFTQRTKMKKCLWGVSKDLGSVRLNFPWVVRRDRTMSSLLHGVENVDSGLRPRRHDMLTLTPETLTSFGVDWLLRRDWKDPQGFLIKSDKTRKNLHVDSTPCNDQRDPLWRLSPR